MSIQLLITDTSDESKKNSEKTLSYRVSKYLRGLLAPDDAKAHNAMANFSGAQGNLSHYHVFCRKCLVSLSPLHILAE
jgi:hypothetical protein